ncbi:MAG: DUF1499 domain-containing protein [Rhodospirillales bacterium]|nr:DUF1499 domain-containing protein [Rhodospirillales bacterium]
MTVLAWLLGLLLPACAASGAHGLPAPRPMDMAHIVRPASPNTALAAPADFDPRPDLVTPTYPVPAGTLFVELQRVAAGQRRVFLAAAYPDRLQLHWVARSAVWNFPDLVTGQVLADGPAAARLILYSRSVYGYGDFGVNRRRLDAWLAALTHALAASTAPKPHT